MPMKDIHLYRFHAIEVLLNHIERHKMPTDIDHQSSPGKTRLVIDCRCRDSKSRRAAVNQLQKSLQPMQHAERIWGSEQHSSCRDLQMVRLIFIKLLHYRTRPGGFDEELRSL